MALDFTDERLRALSVERELDDGALGGDLRQKLLELTIVDCERLRLAAVAVDDSGNATRGAERSCCTLAGAVAWCCG